MRTQSRRSRWFWIGIGPSLLVAGSLVSGCGGGEADGGDSNYTQKFETPTGPTPAPKIKLRPVKPLSPNDKDLSPRERRALKQSQ